MNNERMSFIKTYDESMQDELEAVVNKQIQEIRDKDRVSLIEEDVENNKKRVMDTFQSSLSENKGDLNKFLILVEYNEETADKVGAIRDWQICSNRQEAYYFLKEAIDDIDLLETIVVAETLPFTNNLSAGAFMVHCLDTGKIEDAFDPRDGEHLPEDFTIE